MATPTSKSMPHQNQKTVPTFNSSDHWLVHLFFSDIEKLFTEVGIKDDKQKVKAAYNYLSTTDKDVWSSWPTAGLDTSDWVQFKKKVIKLYPSMAEGAKYTMRDIDSTACNYLWTEVKTLTDLGNYHSKYMAVTEYLLQKGEISKHKQAKTFIGAFTPDIQLAITQQL